MLFKIEIFRLCCEEHLLFFEDSEPKNPVYPSCKLFSLPGNNKCCKAFVVKGLPRGNNELRHSISNPSSKCTEIIRVTSEVYDNEEIKLFFLFFFNSQVLVELMTEMGHNDATLLS